MRFFSLATLMVSLSYATIVSGSTFDELDCAKTDTGNIAIAACDRELQVNPDTFSALGNRAILYTASGRYDEAISGRQQGSANKTK